MSENQDAAVSKSLYEIQREKIEQLMQNQADFYQQVQADQEMITNAHNYITMRSDYERVVALLDKKPQNKE